MGAATVGASIHFNERSAPIGLPLQLAEMGRQVEVSSPHGLNLNRNLLVEFRTVEQVVDGREILYLFHPVSGMGFAPR